MTEEIKKKLLEYMDGVLEWNEHINLTAIRGREEFWIKHIMDSLSCTAFPEYIAAGNIIDIGTGGGFPGVPLAVVSPEKDFVLVDSTRKKLRVIDDLTATIGIDNVTTVHARAEELAKDADYYEAFDLCVSRAVADLKTLAGWCLPFVKKGGSMIAYKGARAEEEMAAAEKEIIKQGGTLSRIETTQVGEDADSHRLIVIHK